MLALPNILQIINGTDLFQKAWRTTQHLFVAGDGYRFGILQLPPKVDSFLNIEITYKPLSPLHINKTYRFFIFFEFHVKIWRAACGLNAYLQNEKNQFLFKMIGM